MSVRLDWGGGGVVRVPGGGGWGVRCVVVVRVGAGQVHALYSTHAVFNSVKRGSITRHRVFKTQKLTRFCED